MGSPICIRFKDKTQIPYKRLAVLLDHDDWLEKGSWLAHPQIEIPPHSDWLAFSFAGWSLILIWK